MPALDVTNDGVARQGWDGHIGEDECMRKNQSMRLEKGRSFFSFFFLEKRFVFGKPANRSVPRNKEEAWHERLSDAEYSRRTAAISGQKV